MCESLRKLPSDTLFDIQEQRLKLAVGNGRPVTAVKLDHFHLIRCRYFAEVPLLKRKGEEKDKKKLFINAILLKIEQILTQ